MKAYYYTNKLLLVLAIGNLWMMIPSISALWWSVGVIHVTQGNTNQLWISLLLSSGGWFLILGLTTWAFLKRWSWVVIFYVIYLSDLIPIYVDMLIQYWKQHNNWNALTSAAYGYTYVFLWLLGLITIVVMLIETDYKNLFHRWRGRFRLIN